MRKTALSGYFGLFRLGLINAFAYRASSWSFILGGAFYGFIQVSIILAFFTYGNSSDIIISQAQAVSHMWLMAILYPLMPFGHTALYDKIVSGLVAYDLCRPLDLYWHWFTTVISSGLKNSITSLPIILLALTIPLPYTLGSPISLTAFCLFLLSLCLSVLLSASIALLTSLAYINADMGLGVSQFIYAVTVLLSGNLFPLTILPKTIVEIFRLLPFAGLKDIPVSIYMGLISINDVLRYMGIQVIWILILVLFGRFILAKFTKKIVIQGG